MANRARFFCTSAAMGSLMAPGKSGAGLGETLREREERGATGRREEGRGDLLGVSIDGDLLRSCPADASGGARLRGAPVVKYLESS